MSDKSMVKLFCELVSVNVDNEHNYVLKSYDSSDSNVLHVLQVN